MGCRAWNIEGGTADDQKRRSALYAERWQADEGGEGGSVVSTQSRFVRFQRGDGSIVACQASNVLYVAKGDHGTILNFGAGTQVNVREDFEEVLSKLETGVAE